MAGATYPVTTTTALNKIWRKVQTGVQAGLQFMIEEYQWLDEMRKFDINFSTREVIVPLDIHEDVGVASIPEDGWEARPYTPNVEELFLTWIDLNKRFTFTRRARQIDVHSRAAMITRQFAFQGKKAVQAIGRRYGDMHWGYSNGVSAVTSTVAAAQTSGTYVIKDAYGMTSLNNAAYLANLFRENEWVALIRSGSLVANAIGKVTAVNAATPSIDVTWNGSVTSADGDQIVLANSVENTTIDGTDYNRAIVGVLDILHSTSVHGLSSATVADWSPSTADTSTGGRMDGVKFRTIVHNMHNKGGGYPNQVCVAQGVQRDMISLERQSLRFRSPFSLEIDGDITARGADIKTSRRVPNGYFIGKDKKSHRKLMLLPNKPQQPVWDDGDKLQDRPVWAFTLDLPIQNVCLNRKNFGFFSGQTEQ